jgi:Putative lumazine-binding
MLTCVVLFGVSALLAETPDEKDAVQMVQKLFDGMAAKDGAAIRATMMADARLYAVREDGTATASAVEDFAKRISSIQGDVLERFTAKPQVSMRGRMAQVWGEYEFVRGGKFDHCGVDSVSLFKTAEGWKIASIAFTSETTGCKSK